MRFFYFTCLSIGLWACNQVTHPTKNQYSGEYIVNFSFDKKLVDKEKIKDSIDISVTKTEKDLKRAKENLKDELSRIDTTTTEGKIEYQLKSLPAEMIDAVDEGVNTENLGSEIGSFIEEGFGLINSLIAKIKLNVKLNEDGTVKLDSKIPLLARSYISFEPAKWQATDEGLIFTNEEGRNDTLKISRFDNTGFDLEYEKMVVKFVRVSKK